MNLEFFDKQLKIADFSEDFQEYLLNSKSLVIGAGGIGCPLIIYLSSSGFGDITIFDGDKIETSNLQRQFMYSEKDCGEFKAMIMQEKVSQQYPHIKITSYCENLYEKKLYEIINDFDFIFDATDNFESRYFINDICSEFKKPLISGGADAMKGIVTYLNFHNDAPCYECIFPRKASLDEQPCDNNGVTPSVLGIVGTMMVSAALKLSFDKNVDCVMTRIDAKTLIVSQSSIKKDICCNICGDR